MLGGSTRVTSRVNTMGQLDPPLPTGCSLITFNVRGQVKNARNGQSLNGVHVHIEHTSLSEDAQRGFFGLNGVPAGEATIVYEKDGYIKATKTISMHDDITAGGQADVSMSPKMSSDQWRAVLKWDERPYDLDTYAKWGNKKVCWYGTRKESHGIRGTLEHDDTRSYGPETLHLTGVGHCRGSEDQCDVNYEINDYGRTGDMKNTNVEVTLYTGESVAGTWKIKDCLGSVSPDGNWWHVFTVDGKNNRLKWNCKQEAQPPGQLHLYASRRLRRKSRSYSASKARGANVTSRSLDASRATNAAKPSHEKSKNIEESQKKSLRAATKPTVVARSMPNTQSAASPRLRAKVKAHSF